jgi:HAD superfamily phosphoserine phosphatase-like hydrolase
VNNYVAVDVDGTLVTSNISFLFGKYLYKRKMLSLFSALWMSSLYFLHQAGLISLKTLHKTIFSSLFKGKSLQLFEQEAEELFSQATPFRPEVIKELKMRKEKGERIVLLSASPDFLVRIIAKILSVPEWYGTEYLVDAQGNFSDLGQIMTGEEKASVVKRECQEHLVAITDSKQDLPLVLLADEVLLVAPSYAFRRKVRHKGWKRLG